MTSCYIPCLTNVWDVVFMPALWLLEPANTDAEMISKSFCRDYAASVSSLLGLQESESNSINLCLLMGDIRVFLCVWKYFKINIIKIAVCVKIQKYPLLYHQKMEKLFLRLCENKYEYVVVTVWSGLGNKTT